MDRWSIARQFRAAFGMSPSRFRTMRQLGVAQIAGFSDRAHLTRVLKRGYGMPPAVWATAVRGATACPPVEGPVIESAPHGDAILSPARAPLSHTAPARSLTRRTGHLMLADEHAIGPGLRYRAARGRRGFVQRAGGLHRQNTGRTARWRRGSGRGTTQSTRPGKPVIEDRCRLHRWQADPAGVGGRVRNATGGAPGAGAVARRPDTEGTDG